MYTYQAPPGQYGQPQSYGGFPQQGVPPGMGAPPGMGPPGYGAPGMGFAPGMQQAQNAQPGAFPSNFQPPTNMPNINFSAPVIRLGTTGPGKPDTAPDGRGGRRDQGQDGGRRGMGLGFEGRGGDRDRYQRDNIMSLAPPTREEVARTIFIGNLTEGTGGDDGIQRILATAGGLRRWTRASDQDSKPCTFGFAEYEDADSLATACEIFQEIEVPIKKPTADDVKKEESEDAKPQMSKLLVIVDENSQKYIEEWRGRGALKDASEAQFRLDSAREELAGVLASLKRFNLNDSNGDLDRDGDMAVGNGDVKIDAFTGEIVTIPLNVEDELADIPAEMRETVAKEIAAFRDRSSRRDLERLKREEEMEQAERARNAPRPNRLASPPVAAGGGANGIPLGPRERGVQGAPLGPKGFGAQIPKDYQKGVAFVNGNGANGYALPDEDEDTDASDEELERRRKEMKNSELEKLYLDQERRWLNRERSRTAAVEREKNRDKDEESHAASEKAAVAKRLKEWNDESEASRKVEEYYHDRSQWLRNRAAFRAREVDQDNRDRAAEDREKGREQDRRNQELGWADQFLARQAEEIETRTMLPAREPQRVKISLGAAAQRVQAAAAPRRTIAEVEGLLEDEEDEEATTTKRTLVPIAFDPAAEGAGMTEEERAQAARRLAGEIPTDKEGLWKWDVKWEFVDAAVVTEQLRPFVEKKIVEYLGVQEQMLVDIVEDFVRKRGKPQDLVGELEGALEDEAEILVKKLWRMLIFFSESEKRGLSG